MSPKVRSAALLAAALLLACDEAPSPRDAGEDPPDASVVLGSPCEKTQGVCAGAVHARLADGGFEPVCTALSYGPSYEAAETRCDGLDNDCDGETDRHWAVVHQRNAAGTWSVLATRVDAGFVVFGDESDGGYTLRRLDERLASLGAEELQPAGTGGLDFTRLFSTRLGLGLTYLRADSERASYFAPLSREGATLRGDAGEPLVYPLATWGGNLFGGPRSAPSADGTRVVSTFPGIDAGAPAWGDPDEVLGTVVDEGGNLITGPTSLMRAQPEGSGRALYAQDISSDGEGFLLVAREGGPNAAPDFLRLQRLSSTLELVGEERTLEVRGEPGAQLASEQALSGETRPAVAYRERDADGGVTRIRVLRNPFDGGQPETWAEVSPGVPWLTFQGSARGLQLAWKEQTYCPECTSPTVDGAYRGRVFARSESSGIVELTPGSGELLFDAYSRPGVGLTEGPEGWMTFFLPVMNDGGVELRAVSYCQP